MKYLSMQYLSIVPQYWLPDNPAHQLQLEVAAGAELVEHQEPLLMQGPHLGHTCVSHMVTINSVMCNLYSVMFTWSRMLMACAPSYPTTRTKPSLVRKLSWLLTKLFQSDTTYIFHLHPYFSSWPRTQGWWRAPVRRSRRGRSMVTRRP